MMRAAWVPIPLFAAIQLAAGAPALAETIVQGRIYSCPSSTGQQPVLVWVGRTERWSDHGVTDEDAKKVLVHLQIDLPGGGTMGRVSHAPFEAFALRGCAAANQATMSPDVSAFEDEYAVWDDVVRTQGAGAFTIGPADAYWTAIAARDGVVGQ
jgi:hypothetical protein